MPAWQLRRRGYICYRVWRSSTAARTTASLPDRVKPMKISARNKLNGKIIDVKKGATTAHVRLEIAPGQIVTAAITNEAVEELGLKTGASASAVIKASDVMIAID